MEEITDRCWDWKTTLDEFGDPGHMTLPAQDHVFPHIRQSHLVLTIGMMAYGRHKHVPRHENSSGDYFYWPVKIRQVAGYFFDVEWLMGADDDFMEPIQGIRWVHISDLVGRIQVPFERIRPPNTLLIPPNDGPRRLNYLNQHYAGKIVNMIPGRELFQREMIYEAGQTVQIRDKYALNCVRNATLEKVVGNRFEAVYRSEKGGAIESMYCDPDDIYPAGWVEESGGLLLTQLTKRAYPKAIVYPGTPEVYDGLKEGQVFEMVHPITPHMFVVGQIMELLSNRRMKVRILSETDLDDLKLYSVGRNEFYVSIDSPYIFPCGTIEEAGHIVEPPVEASSELWPEYLQRKKLEPMPFPDYYETQREDRAGRYEIGMVVEAVDEISFTYVSPAVIVDIIPNQMMRLNFMGWGRKFDQWRPLSDKHVYPMGYSQLVGYPLSPPGGKARPRMSPSLVRAQKRKR